MFDLFSEKNIIKDILNEIEKEENLRVQNIINNIYDDILTDNDLIELKKCYPTILLIGYAKDRNKVFNVLENEGFRNLIEFIYIDRVKTILSMINKKIGFNSYTELNNKNKDLLIKELNKLI